MLVHQSSCVVIPLHYICLRSRQCGGEWSLIGRIRNGGTAAELGTSRESFDSQASRAKQSSLKIFHSQEALDFLESGRRRSGPRRLTVAVAHHTGSRCLMCLNDILAILVSVHARGSYEKALPQADPYCC